MWEKTSIERKADIEPIASEEMTFSKYPLMWLLGILAAVDLPVRTLAFVEIFSGERANSTGLSSLGYKGLSIDMLYGSEHDIMTPIGFLFCLLAVLAMMPGALLWLAPPCGTWVWISRAATKRSKSHPKGATAGCQRQNRLVARVCLLILVAHVIGVQVIIEQPQSTLMFDNDHFVAVANYLGLDAASTCLGAFNAASTKRLILRGTAPYLAELVRPLSTFHRQRLQLVAQQLVTTRKVGNMLKVTGASTLSASSAYPLGFGASVALAFDAWRRDTLMEAAALSIEELTRLFRTVECAMEVEPHIFDAWLV